MTSRTALMAKYGRDGLAKIVGYTLLAEDIEVTPGEEMRSIRTRSDAP